MTASEPKTCEAVTPAETPKECADFSFAYSDDKEIVALYLTIDGKTKLFVERGNEGPRIEALYARIRALEEERDGLRAALQGIWDLHVESGDHNEDACRSEWEAVRAALDGEGKL